VAQLIRVLEKCVPAGGYTKETKRTKNFFLRPAHLKLAEPFESIG
jgi:hypothetical protein